MHFTYRCCFLNCLDFQGPPPTPSNGPCNGFASIKGGGGEWHKVNTLFTAEGGGGVSCKK